MFSPLIGNSPANLRRAVDQLHGSIQCLSTSNLDALRRTSELAEYALSYAVGQPDNESATMAERLFQNALPAIRDLGPVGDLTDSQLEMLVIRWRSLGDLLVLCVSD